MDMETSKAALRRQHLQDLQSSYGKIPTFHKLHVFYYCFLLLTGVFAIFNAWEGYYPIAGLEAALFTLALLTFVLRKQISQKRLLTLSVAYVSILIVAFVFLPTVSGNAYIWVASLPFFISFIVGFKASIYWNAVLLLVAIVLGAALFVMGVELYWPWTIAPYIVLPYLVSVLFARYLEQYVEGLHQAQQMIVQDLQTIEESEARYRTLLQSSMNAIAVSQQGKWVYANPACVKLFAASSLDELKGKPMIENIHPDSHALVKARTQKLRENQETLPVVEEKFLRLDGSSFVAEVSSSPIMFDGEEANLITIRDMTAIKAHEKRQQQLQTQLEHAQRLESLGVLAGGIAHDFNNLLMAISGNAELLRMEVGHMAPAQDYLQHIDESCGHAADLCRQMLAYAGKAQHVRGDIDVNEVVRSMSKLMRASVSRSIQLSLKLDDDVPKIKGDVSQIKQMVLNFIVNAVDAIGDNTGEIQVCTFVQQVKREQLNTLYNGAEMKEGIYVILEVKDSGCGMSEALQKKVFDPFVTTKDKGSGLGLSAVLGITRSHGGGLALESKVGEGTVFRVYFPPSKAVERTPASVETSQTEVWHGDGCVLLVDDDTMVRGVMKSFVQSLGFEVLEAEDGRVAVDMFKQYHHRLQAVLMDMTMPRLSGMDAMRNMREIDDNVPVIMLSGYAEEEVLGGGESPDGFVQKPFQLQDVEKVLHQVLEQQGG